MITILLVKPYTYLHSCQNLELPLGIMALSAYLKRELGGSVAVSLLDLRVEKKRERVLFDTIVRTRPDVIGLSLMNFERPFLDRHLAAIRAAAPKALIVAGGAYPTGSTAEALREFPDLDLVVRGEGEETFLEVVRRHLAGTDPRGEPGTAYRCGDTITIAPDRSPIEPLDLLPMPDYAAVHLERYFAPRIPMNVIQSERRSVILMTSRGCPYRCAYCHDIMGKTFRPLSPDRVLEEMTFLHDRYDVREFHIVDDIFNLSRERMRHILQGVIDRGLKVRLAFPNGIRSDLLDEEDIALMKEAGVYNITFSFETASPRLQEMVGKRLDIERTIRNLRSAHRRGIITKGYFMLGFPTETVEEIRQTIALSRHPALDMVSYFKVALFPHTRLAKMIPLALGDADPVDYFTGTSWYEQVTGVPLSRMIFCAYLRFYLPWRIWRLLWRLPRRLAFLSRAFRHLALIFHVRWSAQRPKRMSRTPAPK